MKKIILCPFLLFSVLLSAQTPKEDSAWLTTHYTKIERQIPMRDGIKLFTAIYLPNDNSEKHPILMKRTPYSCAPYGENKFDSWWNSPYIVYFKENYIVVIQDVRGRFMSEGSFEDVRPFIPNKEKLKGKEKKTTVDEASDAYDAIDWLVKNVTGNNGNVGVFGISYPGFYATMAAMSNHPALKAVSPQAPVTDWFIGDDFHHKGVFFLMDAFDFYRGFGLPRPQPLQVYPKVPDIKSDDNYNFFLQAGSLKDITQNYFGDSIKFWNDVMQHPTDDDWWKQRNARMYLSNIKPAILVVGGLFDAEDCYGAWNTYKAIVKQSPNTNCRIVEGPWFHGGWARSKGDHMGNVWFAQKTSEQYLKNFELPFFNYYLKGEGKDFAAGVPHEANVYITGENHWYSFTEWPPNNVSSTDLYLQADGKLSFSKPASSNSFDSYVSDPGKPVPYTEDVGWKRTREYMTDDQRFASRRPDVLVYETDTLKENVTLTGPVTADLFSAISTTDADFVVKLVDVFPDNFKYPDSAKITYPVGGYQMLVRGEIMRGRFRNSFEKPEAFKPNEVSEVKFELPDVAHTFLKGHRIMIQVQSSWFPLADRNPQQFIDIYHCDDKDFVKCTVNVFHDAAHASKIILPVLKQ